MIVYKYGALKPVEGFDLMLSQLQMANRYRNEALELALLRNAALFCGFSKDEINEEYNKARRNLYKKYATGGLLGHRTIYHLDQTVAKSISTRWKCWSKSGKFKSPFRKFVGTGFLVANTQNNVGKFANIISDGTKKAICELRVMGEQKIKIPIILDRNLPEGADLADAKLHLNRIGDRWVYSVIYTIRNAESNKTKPGIGSCSINFGWRVVKEGVRVATVVGDYGTEFLVIPSKLISARKHAESLTSLSDTIAVEFLGAANRRNNFRKKFLFGKGPSDKSFLKFVPALASVKNESDCEHWARRDRHLYQWECDERSKVLRQRKAIYQLWVRKIRTKYKNVTIENYSISDLVKQAITKETPRQIAARHIRFLVAPGMLREEIKSVFGSDCIDLYKNKRTKRCFSCKKVCKFDAAEELVHECEHCGVSWDQDVNNAENQRTDTAAE